jgi:tRNA(fMet)-specific endonuclease VapC
LYFGAMKSTRASENLRIVEAFLSHSIVLPCDLQVAHAYADIKLGLKRQGTPVPENDIWIAAVALAHDLVLATRDRHFDYMHGLRIARW